MISFAPSALAIEQSAAFDILITCRAGDVPTNASLGAAIVAHRMAFRQMSDTPDELDRRLAAYALRAVIYAAAKTREQGQRQVDYLTDLPIQAWEGILAGDPAKARENTLAMCAWGLTRMADA